MADKITKEITNSTPLSNADGKVHTWHLELTYTEGDYSTTFRITETVEPTKKADQYKDADLLALVDTAHWDDVFASIVESVVKPQQTSE